MSYEPKPPPFKPLPPMLKQRPFNPLPLIVAGVAVGAVVLCGGILALGLVTGRTPMAPAQAALEIAADAAEARRTSGLAVEVIDPTPAKLRDGQPSFTLRVTNNTGQPIAAVTFRVSIMARGRSIPLAEGVYDREPPGGLEPGETADWWFRWNDDEVLRALSAGNADFVKVDVLSVE